MPGLYHARDAQGASGILLSMETVRTFPSSFDPIPDLAAIRQGDLWKSCGDALSHFGARTVVLQTPFFWQLFSPLHDVCREESVLIYPCEPENIQAGAEALLRADANVIICAARDAEALASYITEKRYPLPAWILIHRAQDDYTVPSALELAHARVAHEIHASPGVPVFTQCAALIDAGTHEFHLSTAENTDVRFTKTDSCACGLMRYKIL